MAPILAHTFIFPDLKPFSVNSAYVRTFSGVTKSTAAHEFCAKVFNIMHRDENRAKFEEFRAAYDPRKHVYKCHIIAFYPAKEYYTKQDVLSNKTVDVSNFEKTLIDCMWLPKFHELGYPNGAENLNVDDKTLISCLSEKLPATNRAVHVKVWIETRPTVYLG